MGPKLFLHFTPRIKSVFGALLVPNVLMANSYGVFGPFVAELRRNDTIELKINLIFGISAKKLHLRASSFEKVKFQQNYMENAIGVYRPC